MKPEDDLSARPGARQDLTIRRERDRPHPVRVARPIVAPRQIDGIAALRVPELYRLVSTGAGHRGPVARKRCRARDIRARDYLSAAASTGPGHPRRESPCPTRNSPAACHRARRPRARPSCDGDRPALGAGRFPWPDSTGSRCYRDLPSLCLRLQRGCGVRGWGRDGLGTGARGRGARARRAWRAWRALMSTTRPSGTVDVASRLGRASTQAPALAGR